MANRYKLILGCGLSAKIFAFYNREYCIIGTDNTQMTNSIANKLMFLQENEYNLQFLQDLIRISRMKISYSVKSIDVMTYTNKQFLTTTSELDKASIIAKKLCDDISGKTLQFVQSIFTTKLTLSEEKHNLLRIIEVDFAQINAALDKVIQPQLLSGAKITKITSDEIFTDVGDVWTYDTIINTMPYYVFYKLYTGENCELQTLDTTIIEGTEADFGIEQIPYETAIVYFPETKYQFGKIIKRNGKCYAEITGKLDRPGAEIIKNARLVKNPIKEFPNTIMLGRFAEWNPDIRIQDVVRRSSSKVLMQELWKDQKQYTQQFFDFKQDITLVQSNIKQMSLLLNGKTYDLLNTINWKCHKQQHMLDINKVKEEWIGIFKYWCSIGLNLNMSYEDFIDAYHKESDKLKTKQVK